MNEEIEACYRLLELPIGASLEEVKQAWREHVKGSHPDHFTNDPERQHQAQEQLKDFNLAYERLEAYLTSEFPPEADSPPAAAPTPAPRKSKVVWSLILFALFGGVFLAAWNGGLLRKKPVPNPVIATAAPVKVESPKPTEPAQPANVPAQSNPTPTDSYADETVPEFEAARRWFQQSAVQGNAFAQNQFGVMLRDGKGGSQNQVEASKWFGRAAAQGFALAQLNLGAALEHGQGVPQNFVQAAKWYELAKTNAAGEPGRASLQLLQPQLTASQIAEAHRLAQQFHTKPEITGLIIFAATYGSGTHFADVTSRVKDLLNEPGLDIYATPQMLWADPSPGWNKALVIIYEFKSKRHVFTTGEGGRVNLAMLLGSDKP